MTPRQMRTEARESMAHWISGQPWDLFITLTSEGLSHPEQIHKRTRFLTNSMNRSLYGNKWWKRTDGIEYVAGYELQERGSWHSHILLRLPDHDINDPSVFSIRDWQEKASEGGFSWFDRPRSQEAVSHYVCKYVLKDGEIYLSGGFDPSRPRIYRDTVEGSSRVH